MSDDKAQRPQPAKKPPCEKCKAARERIRKLLTRGSK